MLRIVTQNIWGQNDHWQTRAACIAEQMMTKAVDVLCIQETAPEHFTHLREHSLGHFAYAQYAPSDDGSVTPGMQGLAIFSRLPLLAVGQQDLGREHHPKIDPWNRIIQYATVQTADRVRVTIFNTHLFLNEVQKAQGISGCVRLMQQPDYVADVRILVGDFNILLDQPGEALSALSAADYVDVWRQVHPDDPGLTFPQGVGRSPHIRIDGHFVPREQQTVVEEIALINHLPCQDGQLYLSDHIGVLGVYRV